jgi:hypothetical protein
MFSAKKEQNKPNIDYMANEYSVMKLLTKRTLRYFRRVARSFISSLLSQLVNAVSFGGLSNLTSKNLQNAMEVE